MCNNKTYRFTFRYNEKSSGTYGNPRFSGIAVPEQCNRVKITPEFINFYVKTSDLTGKEQEYILLNFRGALTENNFITYDKYTLSSGNLAVIPNLKVSGTNHLYQYNQNHLQGGVVVNAKNFNFDTLEFLFTDATGNVITTAPASPNDNYIIVLHLEILD